jgi:hypothetical protein
MAVMKVIHTICVLRVGLENRDDFFARLRGTVHSPGVVHQLSDKRGEKHSTKYSA